MRRLGRWKQWLLMGAAMLGAALIVGVAVGKFVKDGLNSTQTAQQHKLFVAQVSGCQRQNVRQAAANRNALATWRFDSLFASALTRPQPHQSAAEKRLTGVFRARLQDTADSLSWTPLNHRCATDPTSVQLPVSFSSRQPTSADLHS